MLLKVQSDERKANQRALRFFLGEVHMVCIVYTAVAFKYDR